MNEWDNRKLFRLPANHTFKPFDCDHSEEGCEDFIDLNQFLLEDAHKSQSELITVTYILEDLINNKTLAYYSLMNDKISKKETGSENYAGVINPKISDEKRRYKSVPAVKIARLAVHKDHRSDGTHIGRTLVEAIIQDFANNNKTGCAFVTVDAINQSVGFYEKLGFIRLKEFNHQTPTQFMIYSLKQAVMNSFPEFHTNNAAEN